MFEGVGRSMTKYRIYRASVSSITLEMVVKLPFWLEKTVLARRQIDASRNYLFSAKAPKVSLREHSQSTTGSCLHLQGRVAPSKFYPCRCFVLLGDHPRSADANRCVRHLFSAKSPFRKTAPPLPLPVPQQIQRPTNSEKVKKLLNLPL